LDVDGHVIAASDLVERVTGLLKTLEDSKSESASSHTEATSNSASLGVGRPILSMRALHAELYPPELPHLHGGRARVSVFGKRFVRKLTGWYVEPRWIAQQNFDGHNIHFAAGVVDELLQVRRELEDLRRQNTYLKLQLVASVERINRYIRDSKDRSAGNK
jgi:hypothetical protein